MKFLPWYFTSFRQLLADRSVRLIPFLFLLIPFPIFLQVPQFIQFLPLFLSTSFLSFFHKYFHIYCYISSHFLPFFPRLLPNLFLVSTINSIPFNLQFLPNYFTVSSFRYFLHIPFPLYTINYFPVPSYSIPSFFFGFLNNYFPSSFDKFRPRNFPRSSQVPF